MSASQSYPHPRAFTVDSDGGQQQQPSAHPPVLVPCWTFPPAQERVRSRGKGRGCCGAVSYGLALALLFVLLLVLAALGLGAYQIYRLQEEVAELRQETGKHEEGPISLKQVGPDKAEASTAVPAPRPAAHVIGGSEKDKSQRTLRWEPQAGRAFTAGGVVYQDGGLQVNHTGLYQVYSRVEFLPQHCVSTDALVHSVFLRRPGHPQDLVLMEGNWEGYCSSDQGRGGVRGGRVRTFESYLSAGLQLQKHDRVYVNVTQPATLSHHHHANFFGLYKI